jgi:hypothetical protein
MMMSHVMSDGVSVSEREDPWGPESNQFTVQHCQHLILLMLLYIKYCFPYRQ